jgi:two-component SAPR family response regulator
MAKRSPTIAKITRPTLPGVFRRERLFKLLEEGKERPVIWVSGPAGSGKTTLVADYVETRKIPCLWYQVDESDGDIATFFYYLGLAVKSAAPRIRKPLPLLTPEYLQGITTFSRRYFENLYSRLNPPFALIFDNYQNTPPESMLHEVIKEGLSVVPDGIRIVLISRSGPSPEFVLLHANNKMNLIGWDELRFTFDEVRIFLKTRGRREVAGEVLKTLYTRTEGWAAGLVLLLEGLRDKGISLAVPEKYGLEDVFNYFAKEIFEKSQIDIQDFLLATSFLPRMTPQMAGKLTGHLGARQILSELSQRNYFTHRNASETEVYQYHPLFREFLRARAQESFCPGCILDVKRKAALVLETGGYIEDAVELFRDAGERQEAARLILQQAPAMVAQGRSWTLESWIGLLPQNIVDKNPWLLYWMGACRLAFAPNKSYECFERAADLFKTQKNAGGIYLSLSGMSEAISYGLDTFKPYDHWIPQVYEILDEYKDFPSQEIEARVIDSLLMAFLTRQPHHPDYEYWAEQGLSLLKNISDANLKAHIIFVLMTRLLYSGELTKAELLIDSLREVISSFDITVFQMILMRVLRSFYCMLAAKFDESCKAAAEGLQLASTSGIHIFDIFLAAHGAFAALSIGDMKRADEFLQITPSCLDQALSWGKKCYHIVLTWKGLLERDLAQASLHADLALNLTEETGMPYTVAIAHLGKAIVLHELKQSKEARMHIDKVHRIGGLIRILQTEFMCYLTEAESALGHGNDFLAGELLRKALALGREQGYANAFFWMSDRMAKLCVKALEAGIEVDYVQNLVRKRNLIPDTPPLECENWPWPVKIYTFGRFSLLDNDKLLRGKAQKKPLDMLKAVIAMGGRDVSEQKITDALWPDAAGDTGSMLFKTTLYRLRQLMVNSKALVVCEGRLTLDNKQCWVDAWAFERMLGDAERIWETSRGQHGKVRAADNRGEAVRMTEKAIELYKGHFLEADRNESWTISLREHLQMRYVRAVSRLGYHWEQEKKFEKAADFYQSALRVDDLTEEFYQHLMLCYIKLGRKTEAVKTYQRCCSLFKANFGIEPSPETTAIYKSIMH